MGAISLSRRVTSTYVGFKFDARYRVLNVHGNSGATIARNKPTTLLWEMGNFEAAAGLSVPDGSHILRQLPRASVASMEVFDWAQTFH